MACRCQYLPRTCSQVRTATRRPVRLLRPQASGRTWQLAQHRAPPPVTLPRAHGDARCGIRDAGCALARLPAASYPDGEREATNQDPPSRVASRDNSFASSPRPPRPPPGARSPEPGPARASAGRRYQLAGCSDRPPSPNAKHHQPSYSAEQARGWGRGPPAEPDAVSVSGNIHRGFGASVLRASCIGTQCSLVLRASSFA
ncbi:hypothetical protein C8Q79DRAFT_431425 [Trametes meyenii]|nr:hypothetical protein C8Q79DRAFT_431425 [Trametes meyenii]